MADKNRKKNKNRRKSKKVTQEKKLEKKIGEHGDDKDKRFISKSTQTEK